MKLRPIRLLVCMLSALVFGPAMAADEPQARAIMEAVDARDDGDRLRAQLEMILIDKRGNQRVRRLQRYSMDRGEDILSLVFFMSPADVRNTAFLTYDYDEAAKDDDQWLYLPALRKSKRIANADKSGSFMGSDFNYSDMTRRDLEDYDYRLLKEDEVGAHKVWLIEAMPRNDEVIDESGYKKSVLFVRQDNHFVIRAVHWVNEGQRLKYLDVKQLEQIDDIWFATETHMTTKQGRRTLHKTVLKFHDVRFNQEMDEELFSIRRMEKGL